MPSANPILVVRVTLERREKLKRIARGCGMSVSAWVNAILDDAIPMSEKALRAATLGDEAQVEFFSFLKDQAEKAKAAADSLPDA